jgi:3-hydroxybutyryl-CoA dehydratase
MEIQIGHTAEATRVFDKDEVLAFAQLTGDYNPVHFDDEYAKNTIFKRPIVHGPLVLTLVTTMFANELPGPGSVYLSHDIRFLLPVYYGDTITARLEVTDINAKNHIFVRTVCTNQDGQAVMEGTARLKKY